jgi:hypothetical protein
MEVIDQFERLESGESSDEQAPIGMMDESDVRGRMSGSSSSSSSRLDPGVTEVADEFQVF